MNTERKSTVKGRRRAAASTPQLAEAGDMRAAYTVRPQREVVNTSFNLPVELHQHLKRLAFERGTSMKDLIVEAVEATYPLP